MVRRLQGGAEGISAEAASAAACARLQKAVAVRRAVHAKEAARDLDVPHRAEDLDCIAAVDAERRHEVVDGEDLRGSITGDRESDSRAERDPLGEIAGDRTSSGERARSSAASCTCAATRASHACTSLSAAACIWAHAAAQASSRWPARCG